MTLQVPEEFWRQVKRIRRRKMHSMTAKTLRDELRDRPSCLQHSRHGTIQRRKDEHALHAAKMDPYAPRPPTWLQDPDFVEIHQEAPGASRMPPRMLSSSSSFPSFDLSSSFVFLTQEFPEGGAHGWWGNQAHCPESQVQRRGTQAFPEGMRRRRVAAGVFDTWLGEGGA